MQTRRRREIQYCNASTVNPQSRSVGSLLVYSVDNGSTFQCSTIALDHTIWYQIRNAHLCYRRGNTCTLKSLLNQFNAST